MNTPRKKWIYTAVLVFTAVALAWGGWRAIHTQKVKEAALQRQQTAPAAVLRIGPDEWMTVTQRTLAQQVAVSGSLTAKDSAVIKARVGGELMGLELREGDTVRKGQVVARVDATESEARYRQAQLQAQSAKAQVTIQQRQYDNNRALVDKQFISVTALATSQANLQGAQATYAAAQAAADAARKVLDDTVLRTPIDGQVAKRWVQNGERVNVESPVIEVVNSQQLELVAPLPPQDSLHVKVGQTVQLHIEGANQALSGKVVRISPSAQEGSRTVPVYVQVQGHAELQLRPGLFVQGAIETGQVSGVAIPLTAVRNDQPQPYVQIVREGVVHRQFVQMGAQSSIRDPQTQLQTQWVMVQGLTEGTYMLTAIVGSLPDGTQVELAPASAIPPSNQSL